MKPLHLLPLRHPFLTALLLVAVLAGCAALFPLVPKEDANDAAFVRQVIPILYGRKARGYDEVKLISDLIVKTDRETALRALMDRPEFVDHWAEVLVDDLRIAREGELAQPACFGAPLRATPDGALATFIGDGIPQGTAPGGPFNMSDVVRSALVADNLYPVYKAQLYALMNVLPFASDELQTRERIGGRFTETFLNRQMGCLVCHNSESSTSGAPSGWNRTHPIRGLFEKGLFGASTGEPPNNAFAMFRTDVRFGASAINPWGMQSCGSYRTSLPNDPKGITPYFAVSQSQTFSIHDVQAVLQFGYLDLKVDGLQRTLPPAVQATCNFCSANCQGSNIDITQVANNAPGAAAVKALLINRCQGCHGGAANLFITSGADWANDLILQSSGQVAGKNLVQPGVAVNSYLINKLNGTGMAANTSRMPLGAAALSATEIAQVSTWINGIASQTACAQCAATDCSQVRQDVAGHEAFAFLVAERVVNNVWEETMGYPLTIANYFSRNVGQQQILWNLTEYKLLPRDWSIKDLLVRILTSDFFNRVAPKATVASTAYQLPPVYDPWIEADPRVPPVSTPGYDPNAHPENHKNAMSEGVHRYSARNLANSVHMALDWPAPRRTPSAVTYPNDELMRSIGYYFSEEQPGFQTVDFQGQLAWETVHGTCSKPAGVAVDWIDKLGTAIGGFTPTPPAGPLTVRDVATVLRDWLLADGTLTATAPVGLVQNEVEALRTLFGVASLDDALPTVTGLAGKLRAACGIYVESPQFELAGIVPSGLTVKPRLRVCNTADCSYQEMCNALRPSVDKALPSRSLLLCGTDSVNVVHLIDPPIWKELCPGGWCGRIPNYIPEICDPFGGFTPRGLSASADAMGPAARALALTIPGAGSPLACRMQAPGCDPRCARLDCCGGPLGKQLTPRDGLIAWADGALVAGAEGVLIRPRDATVYEPLQPGRSLASGDLLALRPGSVLEIRTVEGKLLRTPAKGFGKGDEHPAVFMMISGARALQPELVPGGVAPAPIPPALTAARRDRSLRILSTPWAAAGEGGTPLTAERRQGYRYTPEELKLPELRKQGLLTPAMEAEIKRLNLEGGPPLPR